MIKVLVERYYDMLFNVCSKGIANAHVLRELFGKRYFEVFTMQEQQVHFTAVSFTLRKCRRPYP